MASVQTAGTGRQPVVTAYIVAFSDTQDATTGSSATQVQAFDVVLSEEHERTAEVTDHAVEQGVNIVDHVRPNPDKLTLEAVITNTPVYSADAQFVPVTLNVAQPNDAQGFPNPKFRPGQDPRTQQQSNQPSRKLPTQISPIVMAFSADRDYVKDGYERLTDWRDSATLLTVITPRQTYTNMVIEDITMRRSPETGSSAAAFTLSFRQIRVVNTAIVAAPLPVIPRAAPIADKGKKDPSSLSPTDKESLAHLATNSKNPTDALNAIRARLGF